MGQARGNEVSECPPTSGLRFSLRNAPLGRLWNAHLSGGAAEEKAELQGKPWVCRPGRSTGLESWMHLTEGAWSLEMR